MPDQPNRKHPTHGVKDVFNQSTIVLVTVCTKDHGAWLATDAIHDLLCDIWLEATGWYVGRYVIMPTHIHYFASPGTIETSLERWSKYWKTLFTLRHLDPTHEWLPDHWDTRIRSGAHYEERWNYIRNNPVRKHLVAQPDDWPYQGEIHRLFWMSAR